MLNTEVQKQRRRAAETTNSNPESRVKETAKKIRPVYKEQLDDC